MVVPDEQLVQRIVEILDTSDLNTITFAAIRRQLEDDFRTDLSDKKVFIRRQVEIYLQFQQHGHHPHPQHPQQQQQQQHLHLHPHSHPHSLPHPLPHPHPHAHPHPHLHPHHQFQLQHPHPQQTHRHHLIQQQPHQLQLYRGAQPQPFRRDDLLPHTSADPEIDDSVLLVEEVYEEPDAGMFRDNPLTTSKRRVQEKKKRNGGGLIKPCGLSEELQAILGERELSRIQVVKSLWVYIREKNLQDPENRRKIICDDALRALLGCESIDMFQMNKLLSKHIWPLDGPKDGAEPKPKRAKPDKQNRREMGGSSKLSRFMAPYPLSEALMNFLGTGESELPRTEVVKRMWEYIKGNQLQDPSDKRRIVCDSKLRELFGCESFNGFGMARYLSPHFIKG